MFQINLGMYMPLLSTNQQPWGRTVAYLQVSYGYGYTRGSGRVVIFGPGPVRVNIIGYGYGSGSRNARPADP